jgi:hypothetical protein
MERGLSVLFTVGQNETHAKFGLERQNQHSFAELTFNTKTKGSLKKYTYQ